jgi:hypothetical protein
MTGRYFNLFGSVPRAVRGVLRMRPRTVVLAGAVWLMLWAARLVLLLVPLRRLVKYYGDDHGVTLSIPLAAPRESARARGIARAIALAVRYSPRSANCYPQALVARLLLRARGIPHGLYFGVARAGALEPMAAHAWVMVGPFAVCGGNGFDQYTVVRCFITMGGNAADKPAAE